MNYSCLCDFFLMATPMAYGSSRGWRSNLSSSCNLRHSCSSGGSLTHCTGLGLNLCCPETTPNTNLQHHKQKLLSLWFSNVNLTWWMEVFFVCDIEILVVCLFYSPLNSLIFCSWKFTLFSVSVSVFCFCFCFLFLFLFLSLFLFLYRNNKEVRSSSLKSWWLYTLDFSSLTQPLLSAAQYLRNMLVK